MFSPEPSEYGNPARMRDIATAVHDFNAFVAREPSLKVVLLPLRDGLTVLRYTSPQVRYSRYF
jgi:predicted O-methyltransferase YrrM